MKKRKLHVQQMDSDGFWDSKYSKSNLYADLRKRENTIIRNTFLVVLVIIFAIFAWSGLILGTGIDYPSGCFSYSTDEGCKLVNEVRYRSPLSPSLR